MSTCCLANPTHFCSPLISFDHYRLRLWPKLDAAWLIIWQWAANYPAVERQGDKRWREKPPTTSEKTSKLVICKLVMVTAARARVRIRLGDSTYGLKQVSQENQRKKSEVKYKNPARLQKDNKPGGGRKKKDKHEAWCSAWFSSDENDFHHSPDGGRTP